jgi:uncharacterized radical SAM protein YgiQ
LAIGVLTGRWYNEAMADRKTQSDPDADLQVFLPMTRAEMDARGWDELDILLVSGDAYVDHPAFGVALIGRHLESKGFRVGIIAQPDWHDPASVATLGRPRLFSGVSGGAVDSMLNLYTVNKKRRSDDDYSPGGRPGLRPPRATLVYAQLLRQAFPRSPVVIGGVEASLRRLAHYDYWSDRVRASILLDCGADLLVYGMGERAILEAARRLKSGRPNPLRFIPGTVFAGAESDLPGADRTVWIPSRAEIEKEPAKLIEATMLAADHVNPFSRNYIAQRDGDRLVIETEPQRPLRTPELDALYELPFTRRAHFMYSGPVPALETVRFSVTAHRGCYGGCTFCGLGFHQGKVIQSRSVKSVLREVERISRLPEFRGIITDLGGPTANMYGTGCSSPQTTAKCRRTSCLFPKPCPKLDATQDEGLEMLAAVRGLPCVRHAFIASGVRYDLAMLDERYVNALAAHHTGGQLSVAPEHCAAGVLKLMGKPGIGVFERFRRSFEAASRAAGKEQYLIPYLISSFPGCTDADMAELQTYLQKSGLRTHQTQDFTPTPMTLATAMYYSGRTPDGKKIPVARSPKAREKQQSYLRKPGTRPPRKRRGGAKRRG